MMSLEQFEALSEFKTLNGFSKWLLRFYVAAGLQSGTFDIASAMVSQKVSPYDIDGMTAKFFGSDTIQKLLGELWGTERMASFVEGVATKIRSGDPDALKMFWLLLPHEYTWTLDKAESESPAAEQVSASPGV